MDSLFIAQTENSPRIEFVDASNTLIIAGNCCPNNPDLFFARLQDWAAGLSRNILTKVNIEFDLHTLCTSSKRQLLLFLQTVKAVKIAGGLVKVTWNINEGAELQSIGENLDYLTGLKFHYNLSAEVPSLSVFS